jgi:hypothetical protein
MKLLGFQTSTNHLLLYFLSSFLIQSKIRTLRVTDIYHQRTSFCRATYTFF